MLEDVMQKTQKITKMEAEMEPKNVRMLEKNGVRKHQKFNARIVRNEGRAEI